MTGDRKGLYAGMETELQGKGLVLNSDACFLEAALPNKLLK